MMFLLWTTKGVRRRRRPSRNKNRMWGQSYLGQGGRSSLQSELFALAIIAILCCSSDSAFLVPYRSSVSNKVVSSVPNRLTVQLKDAEVHEQSTISDGMLTSETFADRYSTVLPEWLLDKCTQGGWKQPTRIQQRALDAILLDARDCIIQAETGSGKTLCYLLPCLAAVDASRSAVQALIVVPTRELGLQVARVAKRLAATSSDEKKKIMIMNVLQGSQNRRQRAWAWAEPPHVVIGTPQELCNMVRLGGIKRYNSVKMVVVDEVDACLLNNAGSLTSNLSSSTLHELLSKYLSPTYDDGSGVLEEEGSLVASSATRSNANRPLSQQRQTIFCSATIPQHRHFLKQCQQNQWMLREPVHVCLRPGEQLLPPTLEHAYVICASSDKKLASLRRIVQKLLVKIEKDDDDSCAKVLIFAESQRPLEEMARALALDVHGGQGLYWKENLGSSEEQGACLNEAWAIFSVLRYEDSLSQRATAIDAFRGDDYRSMTASKHLSSANPSDSSITTGSSLAQSKRQLRVMFSTDLAARGLDIADITMVVHFDLPPDADTYVHRAGRTGRFGRSGQVVAIVTPEQEFVLQRLANKLAVNIRCIARQQKQKSAARSISKMED